MYAYHFIEVHAEYRANIVIQMEELASSDAGGPGFTLSSFTTQDALELGHLLHARLLAFAPERSALINISTSSGQTIYQSVAGSGTTPDNEIWVNRKRTTVLRFGVSSWMMGRKFGGDEALFASKFCLDPEQAGKYAIHGGAIPIRVQGFDGIVAVVIVSGLKEHEDHGVISETIHKHWE